MKKNTYHLSEVARLLGIRYYRIQYAHKILALPEPAKFNNVRTYFAADVRRIADFFGVPMPEDIEDRANGTVGQDDHDEGSKEVGDDSSHTS